MLLLLLPCTQSIHTVVGVNERVLHARSVSVHFSWKCWAWFFFFFLFFFLSLESFPRWLGCLSKPYFYRMLLCQKQNRRATRYILVHTHTHLNSHVRAAKRVHLLLFLAYFLPTHTHTNESYAQNRSSFAVLLLLVSAKPNLLAKRGKEEEQEVK